LAKIRNPQARSRGEHIRPRESATGSTDGRTPVFCLRFLDRPYCVTECERDEQASLALTMHRLSRLTWQQIRNAPRHGLGTEKIHRESIRAAIPTGITEDVESFLAIRFHGKAPMVGFRSGEVFHLVWLDRAFTLYAHG
jgi:hypothetical protein